MTSGNTGQTQAGNRSALYGYAVLRANFDHNAASYLDNFNAFVLDVLADRYPVPQTEATISLAIDECFGIAMPDGVIGKILKRLAATDKVVQAEDSSYRISESLRPGLASLQASMSKFLLQQAELVAKFETFVAENHAESLDLVDDFGEQLQAFIDRYAAPLLRRGVTGQSELTATWGELMGVEYLVGSFVLHLEANDSSAFGYLIDAVKGAILTGVLELGPGDLRHKLDSLTIILDTPVLLSALGYQGQVPQRAVGQLLELASALSIRVVSFEHTERELSGILDATIAHMRGGNGDALRSVDLHFRKIGATASDVAVEQAQVREHLQKLGVRVIPRPDEYYRFGLDEAQLESDLRELLPTQRESTRLYDLQSLSATHRLRRGSSPNSLERCGFLFVTDNFGLVLVARRIHERHLWPLVVMQSELAALLWVRSPAIADDLPRQQLLAAVYTGMQPPPHLWVKYVEEIERLEARGSINTDEAIILRSQSIARDALMDVTLGEEDRISTESVEEVVSRVREQLSVPFIAEAAKAAARADEATVERNSAAQKADEVRIEREGLDRDISVLRDKLAAIEDQGSSQDEHIRKSAARQARRTVRVSLTVVATALIILPLLKTFFPESLKHLPDAVTWVAFIASLLLYLFSATVTFTGGAVRDWLAPLELRLGRSIERRWRTRMGLGPDADRS